MFEIYNFLLMVGELIILVRLFLNGEVKFKFFNIFEVLKLKENLNLGILKLVNFIW